MAVSTLMPRAVRRQRRLLPRTRTACLASSHLTAAGQQGQAGDRPPESFPASFIDPTRSDLRPTTGPPASPGHDLTTDRARMSLGSDTETKRPERPDTTAARNPGAEQPRTQRAAVGAGSWPMRKRSARPACTNQQPDRTPIAAGTYEPGSWRPAPSSEGNHGDVAREHCGRGIPRRGTARRPRSGCLHATLSEECPTRFMILGTGCRDPPSDSMAGSRAERSRRAEPPTMPGWSAGR